MPLTVGKIRYKPGPDGFAPIFDLGAPTLFADLVTELDEIDSVVCMTFAVLSRNGDGVPKAIVAVRMRMPKDIAWKMCRDLRKLEK